MPFSIKKMTTLRGFGATSALHSFIDQTFLLRALFPSIALTTEAGPGGGTAERITRQVSPRLFSRNFSHAVKTARR
jgi:hypothetical protein